MKQWVQVKDNPPRNRDRIILRRGDTYYCGIVQAPDADKPEDTYGIVSESLPVGYIRFGVDDEYVLLERQHAGGSDFDGFRVAFR